MSLAEIHRKKIGKVSDKWSSYLDFYDDKLWYLQDIICGLYTGQCDESLADRQSAYSAGC